MDHEEREEIPWSNLVSQVDSAPDRRWYIVAAVVAALVLAVVGYRFLSSQATSTAVIQSAPATEEVEPVPTSSTSVTPAIVVTEAELTAEHAAEAPTLQLLRAEVFVTDYFTNDGSDETRRSVREALVPELRDAIDQSESDTVTFVEWARAFDSSPGEGQVEIVRVAYRPLVATGDGYQRLSVTFVSVGVTMVDGVPLITRLPQLEEPWSG